MDPVEGRTSYTDPQRMKLRTLVVLAGEIIAPYWPMRTFVHHNPLHGLESLPFEKAVKAGQLLLGGRGYLSSDLFREYFHSGRIQARHLDIALGAVVKEGHNVLIGERTITHREVLREHLLKGITAPAPEVIDPLVRLRPDRSLFMALVSHLVPAPDKDIPPEKRDEFFHGKSPFSGQFSTMAAWCDRTLGTRVTDQVNLEMVKWCEAFLDEGHSTWAMPSREKGFYGAWKMLSALEWSPCGIRKSGMKISGLPSLAEDALLEHFEVMDIPGEKQQEFLSFHLGALPGWAGFIKWRAGQSENAFQQAFPADLVQYLAVRVWYERELVLQEFRERVRNEGNFESIRQHLRTLDEQSGEVARETGLAPLQSAWRLLGLAEALDFPPSLLLETPSSELKTILSWVDGLPESDHGPVWLNAFESGYREKLIEKLKVGATGSGEPDRDLHQPVRPQAQAVFCIDVRSESFRRHLETVGDYLTFGFAGFFSVFVRFRELGSHHETDQFPVIMKARNVVREVLRSYQGGLLSRHQSGNRLLHAGHELLHDLKENVVTPYVAVESLGWFYGFPLIGKTLFPTLMSKWTGRLRGLFVPMVSTVLTVDKLSRDEVKEMLAAEQRSTIRRALQEQFGDRDLNLSLERLEFLRRRALDEIGVDEIQERSRSAALSPEEENLFVGELRRRHRITHGWAISRMERMTQIGFSLNEQIFTVENALRMMGLTRNFARLVLFCGHGSTSDNNPFESALDCGACGGNRGKANARILATMANKPQVRDHLFKNGISIPLDTYFIAGEHDTTTDEVRLFDLEDLPHTHNNDLMRLKVDLREAGSRNARERCSRFPEIPESLSVSGGMGEVARRSTDWSQVRPEWGLSGNAAFIIGRHALIRQVDLEGRVFLHSYDYREDGTGQLLEMVMTGPQVVGEWISMEHYFSTVDNEVYGGGSKVYHNVVGRFGIMSGPQSDLRTGLAQQTLMSGTRPYHEPMRLLTVIESPLERISQIIGRHSVLQHFYDNGWVRLIALDPVDNGIYFYRPNSGWIPAHQEEVQPYIRKEQNL